MFVETPASGRPILEYPGLNGIGETASGFLEMSNVETVDELVSMISAQRAYEANIAVMLASRRMHASAQEIIS